MYVLLIDLFFHHSSLVNASCARINDEHTR